MAMEPITLFARTADPAGVARRLREIAPEVEIDGENADWHNAVVTFIEENDKRTVTFFHDPSYYGGPDWPAQLSGMRDYFSQFPETDRKARALMLITTFGFALATQFDPDFDPKGDARLGVLFAVAEWLDGVLFTPSSLRDSQGRILFGAEGEAGEDSDAEWPRVAGEVLVSEPLGTAMHEISRPKPAGEADEGLLAPTAARVARRALALTAVTARAILEQDAKTGKAKETYGNLLEWVRDNQLDDEFEPQEREVLQRPLGQLEPPQQINWTWRLEGLVVLAWALNRFEIPLHDELVSFVPLWRSLGLFDANMAATLPAEPALRPRAEIGALRNRLFALHWRLRNFHIRPEVIDFAEFARTCWFGPLDLTGLPLAKGDLALRGKRIDRVRHDVFSSAHSAAQERHQAANWLWEGPERYSEASAAT